MNERLQELLKQSTNPSWDGEDGAANEFNLEKFSELIVRECANYINERTLDWDADLRWIFNDGSGFMDVDVTDLLNKHFGVKEIMLKDRILLLDEIENEIIRLGELKNLYVVVSNGSEDSSKEHLVSALNYVEGSLTDIHERLAEKYQTLFDTMSRDKNDKR